MFFSRKQTTSNIGQDEIIQPQGQTHMALDFLVESRVPVICCSKPGPKDYGGIHTLNVLLKKA